MRSERLIGIGCRVIDLVVVALIVLVVTVLVAGRGLPLTGHPVLVVGGPSMEPALPVGGVVVLESVAPEALAVGDVVTIRSGPTRALFTHRVTRIVERDDGLWIETKGDANAAVDPSISPVAAVVGRVSWHAPLIGYAVALLSSLSGVVFVLAAGATLLLFGWTLEALVVERRTRPPATLVAA
ncbi:MAG TPA: signal peptidase I [Candidatus Limnocylindrales bacterium]